MSDSLQYSLMFFGILVMLTPVPTRRGRDEFRDSRRLPELWARAYGKPKSWAVDYIVWYRWFFPAAGSVPLAASLYPFFESPWLFLVSAFLFIASYKEWPGPSPHPSPPAPWYRRLFPPDMRLTLKFSVGSTLILLIFVFLLEHNLDPLSEPTLQSVYYAVRILLVFAFYGLFRDIVGLLFMAIVDRPKRQA